MDYARYKTQYKTIKAATDGHIDDIKTVVANYSDYINFIVFNEIKKHPNISFQAEDIKQEIRLRIIFGIQKFNFEKCKK